MERTIMSMSRCKNYNTKQIPSFTVAGVLDFVHSTEFYITRRQRFGNDLYPSSDEGKKSETGPVSKTICFPVIRIPDDRQSPKTQ
jgi:hypothetical protein